MENERIRGISRARGVPLWRVADELGLSEPTLYRRLRYPMDREAEEKIVGIIEELSAKAIAAEEGGK